MKYDDETLMAYADGELDADRRAQITAAIERDPELARRVEEHRALRAEVAGAFATVLEQPVPERLRAAAQPKRADAASRGNVVRFPTRGTRPPPTPWRAREWFAMAATLVLGGLLSWKFLAPGGDFATAGGTLVARGGLASALDRQLASEQTGEQTVLIGLTFEARDGAYCRSFVSRETATAGLACRSGDNWRIPIVNTVDLPTGDMRQANALSSPALLLAIDSLMATEPLDSKGEQAARDARWGTRP